VVVREHIYALILAGGSGERLWPLSRYHKPKQLLVLEEEKSLLEATVERVSTLMAREHIWVSTTKQHIPEVTALVRDKVGMVASESAARNTAAAVLLHCFSLYALDPDAVVMITPADHYIPQHDLFVESALHAYDSAEEQKKMILFGAQPTYPSVAYGYIEYIAVPSFPYDIKKFHEKPTHEVAQAYLAHPTMLWNMGIIFASVAVLLEEFNKHAPDIVAAVKAHWLEDAPFEQVPSRSIDYAVLEKSDCMAVLPVTFAWHDVGNLATFLALRKRVAKKPLVVAIDSSNYLIDATAPVVALVGVENICVVQTDDVLLIAHRDKTEKVKLVLDTLRHNNSDEYL
jgi:mannose-1-phosphate guanylyltransferase/mannose-6-phosphate isomerase